MFNLWKKRKPDPKEESSYRQKMDSISVKESIARKILGEDRRKEDRRFEGHDRRLRLA